MKTAFAICILFLLFSCKKQLKETEIKTDPIAELVTVTPTASDNSQNSLDWQGTYKGVTPCADCEGIETELVLNQDFSYVIKTKYRGKGNGKVVEENGNFVWDKKGRSISLQRSEGGPSQYKVGENRLIQLDMEGKQITGDLAEKYILTK
jgi:uncharacterized lipoprotein NlpE involved in copper resistance